MLTVMTFLAQLWNGAHHANARQPEGTNPYPVIAVVDNRAGGAQLFIS